MRDILLDTNRFFCFRDAVEGAERAEIRRQRRHRQSWNHSHARTPRRHTQYCMQAACSTSRRSPARVLSVKRVMCTYVRNLGEQNLTV